MKSRSNISKVYFGAPRTYGTYDNDTRTRTRETRAHAHASCNVCHRCRGAAPGHFKLVKITYKKKFLNKNKKLTCTNVA